MGRIPDSYDIAEWRNTMPLIQLDKETDRIGIGFNRNDGIIRLSISQNSARHLFETLRASLTEEGRRITDTISSAREGKAALEKDIEQLVGEYEKRWDVTVEYVELLHIIRLGHEKETAYVTCRVTI